MENLVSSLLFSHADLLSLALLGRMRCLVRFQPLQSCWSCSDYQSKEKCHAKEMTGDYWTDLISSEPETWTLHQWHQHCKITDQRCSWASLGTGGDGEGQDPEPSPTRNIFSSAEQMAWGGKWAATAWSSFLLPWAQLNPVALEQQCHSHCHSSHPDSCSSVMASLPTDRHYPLQIWEEAILNHSLQFHSPSQSPLCSTIP